jgi:TolB protein
MERQGTQIQRLTIHDSTDRQASWHPSGKSILFESNRTGKFQIYQLFLENKTTQLLHIPACAGEAMFARFAPNGKKIAFSCKTSENTANIVIINRKGKTLKKITNSPYRSYAPQWSDMGNELLFFSRKDTQNQDDNIYLINLKNYKENCVISAPLHQFCPAFAHKLPYIAFVSSMQQTRPELFITDKNGENVYRLTSNNDGETLPDWSPDDKKLLITAFRNGNFEICELSLDVFFQK